MDLDAAHPNLSLLTRALAKLVYKELAKDERLSNIQPQFDSTLELFYWTALNSANQQVIYLPIQHSKDIDFELISTMQQKLNSSSIFIAIADNVANILYYQVTEGFNEKKLQQEKQASMKDL